MPVTPFHFGAGALGKAAGAKYFSFRVFILTQIIIDCESAWNMYTQAPRVHTVLHSFLGSLVAAFAAATVAHFYNQLAPKIFSARALEEGILRPPQMIETFVAALFGAWSHVLLDSIMHFDARPFWPLSSSNPFLYIIGLRELHLSLIVSFMIGCAVWWWRLRHERGVNEKAKGPLPVGQSRE